MNENIRILLVDDDPVFLFLHEMLLKKIGISVGVTKCGDGQQALDFMEGQHQGTLFYVLLDINMPVMNGWSFLSSIQHLSYITHISVFIVSSALHDGERDQEKHFPQVIGSFDKPLTLNDCRYILEHIEGFDDY